jgi:hypothetical protein
LLETRKNTFAASAVMVSLLNNLFTSRKYVPIYNACINCDVTSEEEVVGRVFWAHKPMARESGKLVICGGLCIFIFCFIFITCSSPVANVPPFDSVLQ